MAHRDDRLVLRVDEAAEALGLSRDKALRLIAAGHLPSLVIGDELRVPLRGLRDWIARQVAERSAR